jgi:hypothetical protein
VRDVPVLEPSDEVESDVLTTEVVEDVHLLGEDEDRHTVVMAALPVRTSGRRRIHRRLGEAHIKGLGR